MYKSDDTKANYAVIEHARVALQIRGRRIAAEDYLCWQSATEVLKQANQLLVEAQTESAKLKADAIKSGYREGVDQVFKALLVPILDAKAEARRIVTANLSQVILLAETLIKRILPRLSQEQTMPELLQTTLAEIRDEQQIEISVHSEHIEIVRQTVKAWFASQAHRNEPIVLADASMSRFSCVIRSELGEIHVGFEQQLRMLTEAAMQAAHQVEINNVIEP